jgi:hypothetical protein
MKFADWLWFIAVIVALFSPAIVGILDTSSASMRGPTGPPVGARTSG